MTYHGEGLTEQPPSSVSVVVVVICALVAGLVALALTVFKKSRFVSLFVFLQLVMYTMFKFYSSDTFVVNLNAIYIALFYFIHNITELN